MFLARSVITYH